jgi:hypothetical protein
MLTCVCLGAANCIADDSTNAITNDGGTNDGSTNDGSTNDGITNDDIADTAAGICFWRSAFDQSARGEVQRL